MVLLQVARLQLAGALTTLHFPQLACLASSLLHQTSLVVTQATVGNTVYAKCANARLLAAGAVMALCIGHSLKAAADATGVTHISTPS